MSSPLHNTSNSVSNDTSTPPPSITLTQPFTQTPTTEPKPRPRSPRRSSSLHAALLTKLRPLPFQYIWSVWHSKGTSSGTPTLLADRIPDIAAFYRVYNNTPWSSLPAKDSVHVFRAGVKPLWEDPENLDGGAWVLKVRREEGRAVRAWEEVCIMGVGGELQAGIATQSDHVLGMSFSPRLYWAHISIWTKKGGNTASIQTLQDTVLARLSEDLKPASSSDYYYKKHSDHEGWQEAVKGGSGSGSGSGGGGGGTGEGQ